MLFYWNSLKLIALQGCLILFDTASRTHTLTASAIRTAPCSQNLSKSELSKHCLAQTRLLKFAGRRLASTYPLPPSPAAHFTSLRFRSVHASNITRSSLDLNTPSASVVDLIGVFGRALGTRHLSYSVPRASRLSLSQPVTFFMRMTQIGGFRSSAHSPISMGVKLTAAQDLEINSPRS